MESVRPSRPSGTSFWSAPFLWINWGCEWIAYIASNIAIFQVLEYAGKLTVLIALIAWIADYHERQQAAIQAAWSVVNTKGGGRKDGLEYLARRNVDLRGLNGASGYFSGIVLEDRDLSWSDLADANFDGAYLNGAHLDGSNLSGTNFNNAHLKGAHFQNARFYTPPSFEHPDISGADFTKISVAGATEYLSFARAVHWDSANFDPGVKQFIECVANGSNADSESKRATTEACGARIPNIVSGIPHATSDLVLATISNAEEELGCAIRGLIEFDKINAQTPSDRAFPWLDSGAVKLSLKFAADEKPVPINTNVSSGTT
jgi:uncharacterized protein YjbI with pentapeptide repeats